MEFLIYNFILFITLIFLFFQKKNICLKLNLIDRPNNKSIHNHDALLFGGIFMISSLILNIFFLFFSKEYETNYFSFFLIISFFIIALLDDIKDINPNYRLIITLLACLISIALDPNLKMKSIYFYFNNSIYLINNIYLNYALSTLCILLLVNSFNFIDGINGLATSVGFSIFIYLIIKNPIILNFYYMFVITLFIFFLLNIKYRIFLGDSGNYLISTCIAIILLKENSQNPLFYYAEEIFLLLLIPGIDMLRLFIVRIYNKKNPFKGDLNHLHHKLFKRFGINKTLLIYLVLINFPIYTYYYTSSFLILLILFSITIYFILLRYTS
jgi:UDP-GlcNAc:undecaprenyl-phosphate GlcNAc-1-phosphate transferase